MPTPVGVTGSLLLHGCKSILLVEDEPDLLALLGDLFEEDGLETTRAASAEEALAAIAAGLRPDLVLVDLVMPGMNGDALVRELRAMPDLRRTPIAVMTARRGGFEILREGGADEVLEKPFTLERLNEVVSKLCRKGAA